MGVTRISGWSLKGGRGKVLETLQEGVLTRSRAYHEDWLVFQVSLTHWVLR